MNVKELINTRYSAKKFDATKKISNEDLETIKEILVKSPSSLNFQPWKMIMVQSNEGKEVLKKATEGVFEFNTHKVEQTPLTVIFCAKTDIEDEHVIAVNAKENSDKRFATEEIQTEMLNRMLGINARHKEIYGDWMEENQNQAFINMGFFLMGVAALGLDSVPIGGFHKDIISKEFNLEEQGLKPLAIVSVGYSTEDDFNAVLPKSRLDNVIIEA